MLRKVSTTAVVTLVWFVTYEVSYYFKTNYLFLPEVVLFSALGIGVALVSRFSYRVNCLVLSAALVATTPALAVDLLRRREVIDVLAPFSALFLNAINFLAALLGCTAVALIVRWRGKT